MRFLHITALVCLSLLILAGMLTSCNVPEPVPTATATPDWTETPVPPTATATPSPTPTETPVPENLAVEPSELEGTNLILRYSLDGKVRDKLEELVGKYNENNPDGITVQAVPAYSIDELTTLTSAGQTDRTDLIIVDSDYLRSRNGDRELLLDLSSFMGSSDYALEGENIEPLMPVMQRLEDQDGSFYALPLWTEPAFLFYNKTWAQELGFPDTPTDLASFAEQACAAGKANYAEKDDGKHGTGGWVVSSDPEDVISWLMVFAQSGQAPEELLRDGSGSVFTDTADWLRNLFDNGCAWNSRVKEPYDYFANRYALFYSGTYSDADRQYNAFDQSESHGFDNWDLIVYPTRKSGDDNDPRIYASAVSIAIPQNEGKRENAAWRFIRWLYSDLNAAELALTAGGWPVQDSDAVTRLYRNSGEDKLYQTLSYRQYLVNSDADENWLTDQRILSDGFAYIFNISAKPEDIPGIWEQIGSSIAEINAVTNSSGISEPEPVTEEGETNENEL